MISGICIYYAPAISVTRLLCPGHDALTAFHTLHREAIHIPGLVFMRTCDSTDQCLVITCFDQIILNPVLIKVLCTQSYHYTPSSLSHVSIAWTSVKFLTQLGLRPNVLFVCQLSPPSKYPKVVPSVYL